MGHYWLFYVRMQLETVLLKICLALAERLKSCTFYNFVELSVFAQVCTFAKFSGVAQFFNNCLSFIYIHSLIERERKNEEFLDLETKRQAGNWRSFPIPPSRPSVQCSSTQYNRPQTQMQFKCDAMHIYNAILCPTPGRCFKTCCSVLFCEVTGEK